MLEIESAQNDTYRKLLSLITAKGLKKEGLFLLSGEKLIDEFATHPNLEVSAEILGPRMKPLPAFDQYRVEIKRIQLSAPLFAALDVLGTNFNLLVLRQPEMGIIKKEDIATYKPRGLEVVLPVGDPGNLGALLRSCEAFSVSRVILAQEAAHPFLPKAVKASAGSVTRVPLLRGPALDLFPPHCIALDMDGTPLADFTWPKNAMLVVGEEGQGFGSKNRFRQRLSIPTTQVQSLNAVVAASIALAHAAGILTKR